MDGVKLYGREEFEEACMERNWPAPEERVVEGAIIVGAGPAGMATAACLRDRGVPFVILEREGCIASLWKHKTYDRLKMHIAKDYCQLPLMPFPPSYPAFISRCQFIEYLHRYASEFELQPHFNERVISAKLEDGDWHVLTACMAQRSVSGHVSPPAQNDGGVACNVFRRYRSRCLVVATGENADPWVPADLPDFRKFSGTLLHSSRYRNGVKYARKRVLVVGCGNSGMEIALDLATSGAETSIVVRSPVHVLPLKVFGMSTFSVAMRLVKRLPIWLVDRLLLLYSRIMLGNTAAVGLSRPKVGPLEMKFKMGKTPVLDVGTLARIQSGHIRVKPSLESITENGARFSNGETAQFDAIIFATGYRNNVLSWLMENGPFFTPAGLPKQGNWNAGNGLFVAGLCNKGILGGAIDAKLIANEIFRAYSSK